MAMHEMTRAIRERNYAIFAVGFACSGFGLQMMTTVILWDLWLTTHDALVLGIAGLARALPVVALALVAGHTADKYSRKMILAVTQFGFVAIAICFAAASYYGASVWTWYGLLALSGCVRSFNGPSRNSLMPLLVKSETFENAVAWNSGIFQACAVLGPVVAGALLHLGTPTWGVLLISATLILTSAFLVLQLKPRDAVRTAGAMTLQSMFAGMSHIYKERTIFATLTLDLFGVLLGGATALLPIYADEILGGSAIHRGVFDVGLACCAPAHASCGTGTVNVRCDVRRVHGGLWTLNLDLGEYLGVVYFRSS